MESHVEPKDAADKSSSNETNNKREHESDTSTDELTFNAEEEDTAAEPNEDNKEDNLCRNLSSSPRFCS